MKQLTDMYGRIVTIAREGEFDVYRTDDGLELKFEAGWAEYRAMDTINAHAPQGWVAEIAEG
jgi:hypothetical protein